MSGKRKWKWRGHRGGKKRHKHNANSSVSSHIGKKFYIKCGMGDKTYIVYSSNSRLKTLWYILKCLYIYNRVVVIRNRAISLCDRTA